MESLRKRKSKNLCSQANFKVKYPIILKWNINAINNK